MGKKAPKNVLSTNDEILYNSIWRFLALRGYINSEHHLTEWGKVLVNVIAGLKGRADLEEPALLAVELLRLGLLSSDINMFPSYNGAPMRGNGKSRYHTMMYLLLMLNSQGSVLKHACLSCSWPRYATP